MAATFSGLMFSGCSDGTWHSKTLGTGHRMYLCGYHETGRTLALSGFPLGVVCTSCGHRILLMARQLDAHEADRRLLRRLPLRCRCGSRDVALYLLETPDDAPGFLAGDVAQPAAAQAD